MIIQNLNPSDDIGASSWHLTDGNSSFLLDAGLHPKLEGKASMPMFDKMATDHLDGVLISHCHYDHVAGLPLALKHFPEARVLMSELSTHIVERVLHNSANVMKRQRDELGILDYPLYDNEYVEEVSQVFEGVEYGKPHRCRYAKEINGSSRAPEVTFHDAGHTLGAAGIEVNFGSKKLFYTGDCSFQDQLILKGARFHDIKADVVIMETTRGSYDSAGTNDRDREVRRLKEAIIEVVKRKGSILIPSFALGRTQEMLALLAGLIADGSIPRQAIFIGGLGRIFTEIYDGLARKTHRNLPDLQLTKALNLVVQRPDRIRDMKFNNPKIFVATAGMMNSHTAAHELALRLSGNPANGVFFVGYADPSTPGGKYKESEMGKPFEFSQGISDMVRECEMRQFDITGHANRGELLEWLLHVNPSHVVLAHGEPESRSWFAEEIKKAGANIRIHDPKPGESVTIED